MAYSLTFEPFIAWPALALLATLFLLLAGVMYWQLRRTLWWRNILALALLLAIANPVFLQEERDPVKTIVALVEDQSASQALGERRSETTEAIEALEARLNASGLFEVRRVVATSEDSKGRDRSAVAASLAGAIKDVPTNRFGGAILVTDGQIHDVDQLPDIMGEAPLHSLVTGEAGEIDQRVRFINPQPFAIVGQPTDLTIQVDWDGQVPGEEDFAEITIRINGEELSFETVPIGRAVPLDIILDQAGRSIVEVELTPLEGEITPLNNRAIATIEGVRENLRVLLVSGEPHAGERTWRNLLKSDASVDLVHFTILRPPEKQDSTPINELALIAFPTRELFIEKIDDFDLIVFDRYQYRNVLPFLYYDYIAQYVENGGAMLVAAGPEFASDRSMANTPLASALPGMPDGAVVEAPFYPRISTRGQRHPVTRDLEGGESDPPNWSRWFRLVGARDIEGDIVMEGGDNAPLLVLNRQGAGRVAMFLSDHGWLWARGFEGGGPHVPLYRRIAHWLMQEPELEEERLIGLSAGSTLTVRRQSMAETIPPVTIIGPDDAPRPLALSETQPGIFEGVIEDLPTGLYAIEDGVTPDDPEAPILTALAHVGPVDAPEFLEMVTTTEKLSEALTERPATIGRLASLGGNVPLVVPVEAGRPISGRNWIGLNRSRETILRSVDRYSLFSGPLALVLLLSLAGMMWYRESR